MDTTGAKAVLVSRLVQFCAPLGIKTVGDLKARVKAIEKVNKLDNKVNYGEWQLNSGGQRGRSIDISSYSQGGDS